MTMKVEMMSGAAACVLSIAVTGVSMPVLASDAGAFIGGVLATKVVGNMRRQTEAEEQQAYYASQSARQVSAAAPAPAKPSAEQRIAELDKLAAGGYISKEEYKQKKKAILDSM
ncbi:MAG: SHOCT domain-containing protein [Gammaproteobacteria bacterium]|nr:SHOCT domain-containing protein [Gammaproteobacteria bacterium]